MNRYILIHRLTGPAILLLLGIVALLHELHMASWSLFVPLLLILVGVLKLAERAALAATGDEQPIPGAPYPGAPYPYSGVGAQPPAQPGSAIVPVPPQDPGKNSEGGQS